jgi:hypothetical protein
LQNRHESKIGIATEQRFPQLRRAAVRSGRQPPPSRLEMAS